MGRLVEIEAEAGKLSLRLDSFRSAWRLRQSVNTSLIPLLKAIRDQQLECQLLVGSIVFKVLPNPTLTTRLLVPALKRIVEDGRKGVRKSSRQNRLR